MDNELLFDGECDNCDAIIELSIEADDYPTYCPCCGAEVNYEEVEEE